MITRFLLCVCLVAMICVPALGTYYWTGDGDGLRYDDPANWAPNDSDGYTYRRMDVDDSTILIDGGTHDSEDGVAIAYYGANVTMNITGGTISGVSTRFGYRPGASGTLNISGYGTMNISSNVLMSDRADTEFNLNLSENAVLTVGTNFYIAEDGPGKGSISLSGDSLFSVGGYFEIDRVGAAAGSEVAISLEGNSVMSVNRIRSGYGAGSTDSFVLSGNARLETVDYFRMARDGGATEITVADDAVLDIGSYLSVGYNSSGDAKINLDSGSIMVGELKMTSGGLIDIELGQLLIAGDLRGDATLQGYIDGGRIVGYGDTLPVGFAAELVNVEGVDYTAISVVPEPMSLLLVVGGMLYRRRQTRI